MKTATQLRWRFAGAGRGGVAGTWRLGGGGIPLEDALGGGPDTHGAAGSRTSQGTRWAKHGGSGPDGAGPSRASVGRWGLAQAWEGRAPSRPCAWRGRDAFLSSPVGKARLEAAPPEAGATGGGGGERDGQEGGAGCSVMEKEAWR